jgi:hypothetical protein
MRVLLVAAAIAAGWSGWSGAVMALPLALAFPVLWSIARCRKGAALISAAYFLAASRSLPQGVANFYGSDFAPGLLLWLVASSGFVLVHTVLWTAKAGLQKPLRYLLACLLMAVPPFGILGWAHPITAAGALFPGWGWLGLFALAIGMAALATTRYRAGAVITLSGLWIWSAASWTLPLPPPGWTGVELAYGASLGRDASLDRQQDLLAIVQADPSGRGQVFVLPESAIGFWTPTIAWFWEKALKGSRETIVGGASLVTADGYDNVLVVLTQNDSEVVYRERMPVPGAMWQPWLAWMGESGGARAHFFANPVVIIRGARVAPLICYEQLIVWPILQSMAHEPELIIAVGNGWWTLGTAIVGIQQASAIAWARLFGKQLVMSFNS